MKYGFLYTPSYLYAYKFTSGDQKVSKFKTNFLNNQWRDCEILIELFQDTWDE